MDQALFVTNGGRSVTAVTGSEMEEIDRVAVEEFELDLLQMMENAGRNLAWHVREVASGSVTILAGNGGNGGGGLCAARHLANRDLSVSVVLARDPDALKGATRTQFETLAMMDVPIDVGTEVLSDRNPDTIVDALIGYGLDGSPRGTAGQLVDTTNDLDSTVVSLDVPSGLNATTGDAPGAVVDPDRIVTLALPKTGLREAESELFLADISIPAGVYSSLDIPYSSPFDDEYWIELTRTP